MVGECDDVFDEDCPGQSDVLTSLGRRDSSSWLEKPEAIEEDEDLEKVSSSAEANDG